MKEIVRKYLIHFILGLLLAGAGWVATINTRTFESAKQRVNIVDAVEAMPTEAERAVELANDAHAIEIRQLRYEDNKRGDSLDRIEKRRKDSLTIDAFKKFTVQVEQMKVKLENIESHH